MGSYIHMAESLRCSPKTNTTLLISYTPTQKKKFKRKKKVGKPWYIHKTFWEHLKYLGLLSFYRVNTWIPGLCLPGNHREDVGLIGESLLQSRSLSLNPRRLAAFSHSHFKGTIWDGHIVIGYLHYMEACSTQHREINLHKKHLLAGNSTLAFKSMCYLKLFGKDRLNK